MHSLKANYDKNLGILDEIEEKTNFLQQIRLPQLTDKELTAVNLTAEYMGVDSEYQLLGFYLNLFIQNRTKRL